MGVRLGITPAYAGKRPTAKGCSSGSRDYPSVCGEKTPDASSTTKSIGSPPRMRGKAKRHVADDGMIGITPAYVGKSTCAPSLSDRRQDHPRVCGEKPDCDVWLYRCKGSPPRMRGKASCVWIFARLIGITPAYAGKSSILSRRCCFCRDHPRVCGEKPLFLFFRFFGLGSPPRVRGKAVHHLAVIISIRITPACAGKSITLL